MMSNTLREGFSVPTRSSSWCTEHRDLHATAMSVDWSGQWVLLAGRRHLALQNLNQSDNMEDNFRTYDRNSKYEVSAASWAICKESQECCAIATSQLIEVVNWRVCDPTLVYSLRAHTRVVTDIDWHSKHPHLLASCSIDTFTHLWDLRDPKKPTLSLSAVCMSGATQVGFNRVSGNLVATAHDGDLRIWDIRKGSSPIQYITAHLARIHGINWSHNKETHLTTASQDGTVKYFDICNPRRAKKIITTSSPVWRARYTPIEDGLVTVIVPHMGHGVNSLLLWNNYNQNNAVCSFVGHADVILDFAWRTNRQCDNPDEHELITWSRDQTLRVWNFDRKLQELCQPPEIDPELDVEQQTDEMERQNQSDKPKSRYKVKSCALQHEFTLLNTNIPHIDVELLDIVNRKAMVRIIVSNCVVMLQITFPIDYPSTSTPPEFSFCQGTTIDDSLSETVMKVLTNCAVQRIKKGRTCLERCLRAVVDSLKKYSAGDKSFLHLQSPRLEGALSGALHDACIPFPKTSGARFNHVGMLITFCQPLNTKRITLKNQSTPRALSALSGGYLGNVMGSQPVLYRGVLKNTFYLTDRNKKLNNDRFPEIKSCTVNVYDTTKLMMLSRELAESYMIDIKNIHEMCNYNKELALKTSRADLVECWTLAEIIADHINDGDNDNENPYARTILESLIDHYTSIRDMQTAAMLCFLLHKPEVQPTTMFNLKPSTHLANLQRTMKSSVSPYHTILPETNQPRFLASIFKHIRSNSWSDLLESNEIYDSQNDEARRSSFSRHQSEKERVKPLYLYLRNSYVDLLSRWNLLITRAKVEKYFPFGSDQQRIATSSSFDFGSNQAARCVLCRLPVRGINSVCPACGHGGHISHMKRWFEQYEVCATGCGCKCGRGNRDEKHII